MDSVRVTESHFEIFRTGFLLYLVLVTLTASVLGELSFCFRELNHKCQTNYFFVLEPVWGSNPPEGQKVTTYQSCSHLQRSHPGRRRSPPCRLPSCCSCWRSTPASSPPPRTRAGTGTSRWCIAPDPSSHWGISRPCSLRQWRTPRTHTPRRCTGRGPSSLPGTEALSSSRLRNHGHTRTPLQRTLPGQNSCPGSEAPSSFCQPSRPHRCSHTGQN